VTEATPVRRPGAGGTSITTGTTSGSLTIAKPTSAAAGDVLLATMLGGGNYTGISLNAPAGWNAVRLDASNQGGTFDYTHVVGASEPSSYTWSGFIGDATGGIAAFSGVDTTTPVNVSSSAQDNDSGTVTAPSVTTTRANVLLVGNFGGGGLSNHTPPASMTTLWSGFSSSGISLLAAQESWATPGPTGNRVATGPGAQSVGQLIALQPPRNPYVTTTWTPSSSTFATAQDFQRTANGVLQVQSTLTTDVNSRTAGPLITGVSYTTSVAATLNNWTSPRSSASFTGLAC
jgi:hypothetical protein